MGGGHLWPQTDSRARDERNKSEGISRLPPQLLTYVAVSGSSVPGPVRERSNLILIQCIGGEAQSDEESAWLSGSSTRKRSRWRPWSGSHTKGLKLCVWRRSRVCYSPVPHHSWFYKGTQREGTEGDARRNLCFVLPFIYLREWVPFIKKVTPRTPTNQPRGNRLGSLYYDNITTRSS